MKRADLLPCPFCGSGDLEIYPDRAENDNVRIYAYHVSCRDCGARGRNHYPVSWCETHDMAMEAWNDRFVPATISGTDNRVQITAEVLYEIEKELKNISGKVQVIQHLLTPIKMHNGVKK